MTAQWSTIDPETQAYKAFLRKIFVDDAQEMGEPWYRRRPHSGRRFVAPIRRRRLL